MPGKIVVMTKINDQGKEIPYQNISRVIMKKYPLISLGKITLELSGIEQQKYEMDYMENPTELAQFIEAFRA